MKSNEAPLFSCCARSQAGYLLNGPKIAFVGGWLGSATPEAPFTNVALDLPYGNATRFTLRDAVSGAPAFEGEVGVIVRNRSPLLDELSSHHVFCMRSTRESKRGTYERLP